MRASRLAQSSQLSPAVAFRPTVFILGAAKCGTTTLHAYLATHDSICMSSPKEPFFYEAEYALGLKYYQATYFSHWKGEHWIGEARHRNLYLPFIPARIHETSPDAKLIVLARNPIERAFSHWYHNYYRGNDPLGFRAAIRADYDRIQRGLFYDTPAEEAEYVAHFHKLGRKGDGPYRSYLDSAYYMMQVRRYLSLFQPDQLMIVLFDDLQTKPAQVMADIANFLGVSQFTATGTTLHENPRHNSPPPTWLKRFYHTSGIRSLLPPRARQFTYDLAHTQLAKFWQPKVDRRTRTWLRDHYRDHVAELATFLDRDLSHWN